MNMQLIMQLIGELLELFKELKIKDHAVLVGHSLPLPQLKDTQKSLKDH